MSFEIDTGVTVPDAAASWRISKRDGLETGVLDSLDANATQAQIDAAIIAAILGDLHGPRLLRTVRMHLVALWPVLVKIASRDPAAFDAVLMAYAELSTILPETAAGRSPASKA